MNFKDLPVGSIFKLDQRSACSYIKTKAESDVHEGAGLAGYKEYFGIINFREFPVWWQEEVYPVKQEEKSIGENNEDKK